MAHPFDQAIRKQLNRKLRKPFKAKERKINRGIKNDPEIFEASDEELAEAKAASEKRRDRPRRRAGLLRI